MADEMCLWCSAPATHYCDCVIGFERRKEDGTIIMDEAFTCDAPMCEAHRKQVGHVATSEGPHDTVDVCPEHKAHGLTLPRKQWATGSRKAAAMRAQMYVAVRRSRVRLLRGEG